MREPRALSTWENRSWKRVGRVLAPGNHTLPPYDYINAQVHVPAILAASSEEDEQSLRWVVLLLGFLPLGMIRGSLKLLQHWAYQWPLGALPRLLLVGLKGVVYTSYYAGVDENNQVHKGMAFALACEPVDKQAAVVTATWGSNTSENTEDTLPMYKEKRS